MINKEQIQKRIDLFATISSVALLCMVIPFYYIFIMFITKSINITILILSIAIPLVVGIFAIMAECIEREKLSQI